LVLLIQLVLNLFLKAVIEQLYKTLLVNLRTERVLLELGGVRGSRFRLPEPYQSFLRIQFFVRLSKHFIDFPLEPIVTIEHLQRKFLLILRVRVPQKVFKGRFEPSKYLAL
jgi:hypothetical protein